MRSRLLVTAISILSLGCAHIEAPLGGPEDHTPPSLVAIRPDSMAVVPNWSQPVTLAFNERISEEGVEDAVIVSPRTSSVKVDHSRHGITVSLRGGWQPGVIYHVVVRPSVRDLFSNPLAAPIKLVFSTGPAIPATAATGTVVDRITLKPDTSVRVEAIRRADSLVYVTIVDSVGDFSLTRVPAGEYEIRAYRDVNHNRILDVFEARDSASATLVPDDSAHVALSVVDPDSTAPVAASASIADSATITVKFDDYLDPAQPLTPATVQVIGPDSAAVPVLRVSVGEPPRRPARRTAAVDTAVADTTAVNTVAPDTVAADTATADTTAADTAASAEPVLPSQTLTVQLADSMRLVPDSIYGIFVRGIRNIVGLTGDSQTEVTAPAPPPPPGSVPSNVSPDSVVPDTIVPDTVPAG